MKQFISVFTLLLVLAACSSDSSRRNPYLQDIGFRFDINTNLPLYSPLTNAGTAMYFPENNGGLKGFFVMNLGFDSFIAFEASCPNHIPNDCSTMTLKGQVVTCSCDDYQYSLANGQLLNRPEDKKTHDLLLYKTTTNTNVISVFN